MSIVRNQGFTNHFARLKQVLDDFQSDSDHIRMTCIQGGFNGDDQLGNHRQDLVASLLQHFVHTHDAQEAVRVVLFTDTIEENGQVMVVVQFFTRNFPHNLVADTRVVDFNGQVSTVIESAEFRLGNVTLILSVCHWRNRFELFFGFVGTDAFSAVALGSLLHLVNGRGSHGEFLILLALDRFDLFNLHVFKWEVSEAGVGVTRRIFIFPGFKVDVLLFS